MDGNGGKETEKEVTGGSYTYVTSGLVVESGISTLGVGSLASRPRPFSDPGTPVVSRPGDTVGSSRRELISVLSLCLERNILSDIKSKRRFTPSLIESENLRKQLKTKKRRIHVQRILGGTT